jgi:glycosyltransferase involved in cell wall biosynthesis
MSNLTTSVIIPAYNESFYLDECLSALLNQSVPIDEIIVVDNNSTDNSIRLAKQRFPEVKFIFETKQGIPFARNKGFDMASGDILIKIDADTICSRQWHAQVRSDFANKNIDGWTGFIDSNEIHPVMRLPIMGFINMLAHFITPLLAGCRTMLGNNMAISKELWSQISKSVINRNDIFEDLDVSLAAKAAGARIYVQKQRLVKVSARTGNVSWQDFLWRTKGLARLFKLRGYKIRAILSIPIVYGLFVGWLIVKPLAFVGRLVPLRPNPRQN